MIIAAKISAFGISLKNKVGFYRTRSRVLAMATESPSMCKSAPTAPK
jgi:hypothetical protein